jgi:uncharacterized protein YkwD
MISGFWNWWQNFWHPKPVVTPIPIPPPLGNISLLIKAVFLQINTFRSGQGLPALKYDQGLAAGAQEHSVVMASKQALSHDGFEQRIESVHPNTAGAENVEYNNYQTAVQIVQQWANSPPHRANMVGNYDLVGLGCCTGTDNNNYWTATFDQF